MTFSAIVTSHSREAGLRAILGCLRYQTRTPDETLVFVSGLLYGEVARLREDFPDVVFATDDDRQDWGHAKRAAGVDAASCDWLGFFNDDDDYQLDYLEKMLAAAADGDAVYCEWNEYPNCQFRLGSSTSGNFIVKASLARLVGYPDDATYENDGHFINRVASRAERVVKVEEQLYTHNAR